MNSITKFLNIKHAVLAVAIAGLLLSGALMPLQKAHAQSTNAAVSEAELMELLLSLMEQLRELQERFDEMRGDSDTDDDTTDDEFAGAVVPVDSVDTETNTSGDVDTMGEFTIEFDVMAVGTDIQIPSGAVANEGGSGVGALFNIETGTGGSSEGAISASLSSTADEDSLNEFTVHEGETESFTLTVAFTPEVTAQYRVVLEELRYYTDLQPGLQTRELGGADYRTSYEHIKGSDGFTLEWDIDDVESVTSMSVDPIPGAIDDEYTRYDIILTNGTEITVKQCGFCPPDARDDAFYNKGFEGDPDDVRDMATDAKSDDEFCRSGDTWYKEGAQLNSIDKDGYSRDIVDGYFECDDGEWEIVGTYPEPPTPPQEDIMAKIVFVETTSKGDAVNGQKVKLGNTGTGAGDGDWFPITKNGVFIDDHTGISGLDNIERFHGLGIARMGNGTVRVGHVGNNPTWSDRETTKARIVFKNATIVDGSVKGRYFESHDNYNEKNGTDFDFVEQRRDDRVVFRTYVNVGRDVVQMKVEPIGQVQGASTTLLDEIEDTIKRMISTL